jgi:type IV secretory pathway VirJ component
MKPWNILTAMVLAAGVLAAVSLPALAETVPGGRYGPVELTRPAGPMRAFIVLFSDRGGWDATDRQAAALLAQQGALVVGVDTERYARSLALLHEACHPLVGDAEGMSHQLEREQPSGGYLTPIAAGVGQGAVLAEHLLVEAPANTLAGIAALDPQPRLDARFKPCPVDASLSRGTGLPGFHAVGSRSSSNVSPPGASLDGQHLTVQHFAAGTSSATALFALLQPHLQQAHLQDSPLPASQLSEQASALRDVADLPLIELPAAKPGDMLALVISGDGGWRDLDKSIGEALQKSGVSVVGLDSLRYFWGLKTPQQSADDVARVIQVYSARWHTRKVALIGYSFGADVMPFVYNRLPPSQREQVSLLALLGLAHTADFQIRVTGWLGLPASAAALPVAPEIGAIAPALIQCFYGEDESDTLCPSLAKSGAAVNRTGGGHHFGRDYASLEQAILIDWRKQAAARQP